MPLVDEEVSECFWETGQDFAERRVLPVLFYDVEKPMREHGPKRRSLQHSDSILSSQ